jgi:ComF family protein
MFIDNILSLFSPHICKGCGQTGAGLCESCFFDIISEKYGHCLVCGAVTNRGLCRQCAAKTPFDRVFVVGERRGVLKHLVGDYKYNSERGNTGIMVRLLDETLPILPDNCLVVPIPTIAPHIRRRGFGHTELVGKGLAKLRHLEYDGKLLQRANNSVQHGLTVAERRQQAKHTFRLGRNHHIPGEILLFDDIYTTGATITAAAKLLKNAGVKTINLAIIARQVR